MNKPQIKFVPCNLETMRELWCQHASHIIPNCHADPPIPCKPNFVTHLGQMVMKHQLTFFYSNNLTGEEIAVVYRVEYLGGVPDEYPLLFRVSNTVYILTIW
jgi:hypothetical protein